MKISQGQLLQVMQYFCLYCTESAGYERHVNNLLTHSADRVLRSLKSLSSFNIDFL